MFMKASLTGILILLLNIGAMAQQKFWLFAGTYTGSGSNGIYVYKFDAATGNIDATSSINVDNPSYIAISNNGKNVYSVTENGGENPGEISAFSFNNKLGKLTFLNKKSTMGDHPCYVAVDAKNKWVAAANYSGGSLTIKGLNKNGSINDIFQKIQHQGTGPVSSRQEKPHVHSVTFSPDEKYLVAADLGTDKVTAYPFTNKKRSPLDTENPVVITTAPGAGPRHIAFHPSQSLVYIMEELSGTVSVYNFGAGKTGLLQTIISDTISPLPDRGSADIHFSPDGNFLYTSNRGNANNLTIYAVNEDGTLTTKGYQSVQGEGPRNFIIDPTGNYLLVANQKTNNIVVFKRDISTGLLTSTGKTISISKPVCLKMTAIN
jgi:6-phosphogluconolactonase